MHAHLSGDMFRMFEHAPIAVEETEDRQAYRAPGEIICYPPIKEIAIAYGAARFRGTAGALYPTPLGAIDTDELPRLAKSAKPSVGRCQSIQFRGSEAPAPGASQAAASAAD